MNDILQALRARREAAGLTLRDLAPRVGVAHQTLGHWERGDREPTWDDVVRWAAALGVEAKVELREHTSSTPARRVADMVAGLDPDMAALVEAQVAAVVATKRKTG